MELYYKNRFNHYKTLFEIAINDRKNIKLYEFFFQPHELSIESGGCGCCDAKYDNIYISGYMYKPYKYGGIIKYKKYNFSAYLASYYLMCKKFDRNPIEFDNDDTLINDFEFKCEYDKSKFLNRILSIAETNIVNVTIIKEKKSYAITETSTQNSQ